MIQLRIACNSYLNNYKKYFIDELILKKNILILLKEKTGNHSKLTNYLLLYIFFCFFLIKMSSTDKKKEENKVTFNYDKLQNFNEWYDHILSVGDIMDKRYPVKGMPIFTSYGYGIHCRIMDILEQEWHKQGIDKVQFPILIPETYLAKEADHLEGFSAEVFWATEGGSKPLDMKYALRPTSETAMYSMFSLWVRSFRDLPLKIHQTCCVYRYETKDTMPLVRAREIHWNEAHTCHSSKEDALENLENAWKSYLYLLNDCMGVYGLRIRRPEWDKFAGAEHTDVLDCVLPSGKVLQSVGAHYLGQIFSKSFDIKFLNQNNEWEHAYMTCYGVSTRMLACCIAAHGDNNGLVLPSKIAKFQIVIVPIVVKGKDMAIEASKELKNKLNDQFRVVLDDSDKKPGDKYFYWEMKGVPLRVEIGPRDVEKNQVCVVRRDNRKKEFVSNDNLITRLKEILEEYDEDLRQKSKAYHESKITTCLTMEETIECIKTVGGFARVPFYTRGKEGKEGDKIIHEKTGGEVRGFIPDEKIEEGLTCIATGKPATTWAYVARSY